MSISDDEMSQVLEALRTAEIQSVEIITEDRHADARAALLADIRAIVRSELDNMLELFDYYDALVEVIQSAPDDDADMKGMLLDWLREVRLS